MRADVLPKGRTIPIQGDVVKTLRLEGGWERPLDFAKAVKISSDRLAEIERGDQKIYKATLMRMARVLNVVWQTLVDWNAIDGELLPNAEQRIRPNLGKHRISIKQTEKSDGTKDITINDLVSHFATLTGEKGSITAVTVGSQGLVITLEISNQAVLKFVESYFDGKNDPDTLAAATLHLDYRVAGLAFGGCGYTSRIRFHYELLKDHLVNLWAVLRGSVNPNNQELPLRDNYYIYKYQKFEKKLYDVFYKKSRDALGGKTLNPYSFSGLTAFHFRQGKVGMSVLLDIRDTSGYENYRAWNKHYVELFEWIEVGERN